MIQVKVEADATDESAYTTSGKQLQVSELGVQFVPTWLRAVWINQAPAGKVVLAVGPHGLLVAVTVFLKDDKY